MRNNYFGYLRYILEHKKNVFKTCWKRGLYIHAFTHDLSKFLPSEFIPYARWFYGKNGTYLKDYIKKYEGNVEDWDFEYMKKINKECNNRFKWAWAKHYTRNKHHWNHWFNPLTNECEEMPHKYIMQMICDWEAMALKFGDTAQVYYLKNYNNIELADISRLKLEIELGLNESAFHNYGHTLKQFKEIYNEKKYNKYFEWIKDKYGIDTYNTI